MAQVESIAFCPSDPTILASGGEAKKVPVWEWRSGEQIGQALLGASAATLVAAPAISSSTEFAERLAELASELAPAAGDAAAAGPAALAAAAEFAGFATRLARAAETGRTIVGLDVSSDMVAHARAENAHERGSYAVADLANGGPLLSERFQVATSTMAVGFSLSHA